MYRPFACTAAGGYWKPARRCHRRGVRSQSPLRLLQSGRFTWPTDRQLVPTSIYPRDREILPRACLPLRFGPITFRLARAFLPNEPASSPRRLPHPDSARSNIHPSHRSFSTPCLLSHLLSLSLDSTDDLASSTAGGAAAAPQPPSYTPLPSVLPKGSSLPADMADLYSRCATCKHSKALDQFNTFVNGTRKKTCTECLQQKREYRRITLAKAAETTPSAAPQTSDRRHPEHDQPAVPVAEDAMPTGELDTNMRPSTANTEPGPTNHTTAEDAEDVEDAEEVVFDQMPEYRYTAEAIIFRAPGATLTAVDLRGQFFAFSEAFGRRLEGEWPKHLDSALQNLAERNVVFRRGRYTVIDKTWPPAPTYFAFAGSKLAFPSTASRTDDIDVPADLQFYPSRLSRVGHGADQFEIFDVTEGLSSSARKRSAYYNACFNPYTTHPESIDPQHLPDLLQEPRAVYEHHYSLVRSSFATVFSLLTGQPSKEDTEALAVLDHFESASKRDGRRRRVVFVVGSIDGWFLARHNWEVLSQRFPSLDLRITMLEDPTRVAHLPHLFTIRTDQTGYRAAWAHCDIHLLAQIAAALRLDPDDDIQWRHLDQWAIVPWLQQAHFYKKCFEDGSTAEARQEAFPMAKMSLHAAHRHVATSQLPEIEKKCARCSGDTIVLWHRDAVGSAEVICDACARVNVADDEPGEDLGWSDSEAGNGGEM